MDVMEENWKKKREWFIYVVNGLLLFCWVVEVANRSLNNFIFIAKKIL
jgi:hypothetical protein